MDDVLRIIGEWIPQDHQPSGGLATSLTPTHKFQKLDVGFVAGPHFVWALLFITVPPLHISLSSLVEFWIHCVIQIIGLLFCKSDIWVS